MPFGRPDPHVIAVYRGYTNGARALVLGRVLGAENIPEATAEDSLWRNLLSTFKRAESDPLPHARVEVRIAGTTSEVVADDEGFFRAWIDLTDPLPPNDEWHRVECRLLAPLRTGDTEVVGEGLLRNPAQESAFGVISDLDDTIIQSRISNFLQAVRTVMLGNARTRLPFPGVAAFYQALERGKDGDGTNPIFYVSSSPWNIYDIIADFMEIQGIPVGPILLRDWDIHFGALSSKRLKTHKEPLIREILELYPSLPFILIGDNSQKDPEIYRAILDHYPGRIPAIYIRNIDDHPERSASLKALADEVLKAGSTLVLADDTLAAAKHAAEHGWIAADSVESVREEKKADTGESGTKVDVPGVPEDPAAPTVVVE